MSATPRSFSFLVNPASGGGAAPEVVVPVARALREAGARVDVTYSPGPRATGDLVAAAVDHGDVVVSVGGDGMLASLAGEVSARGGTLALVPAGRGNDFARMLELPTEPDALARLLLTAEPRPVDLLCASFPGEVPRVVAGSVYSGVDARAAAIVARARWLPHRLQYPLAAVRALASYRPADIELVVDGLRHDYSAATVVVANSAYYGKGMRIAPDARLDDGLLDVVVIEAASRPALVRSFPTVYDGRHVHLPEVTVLHGVRVEVRADGRTPVPVGGDGEPLGALPGRDADPLVVEVQPGALRVLA